MICRICEKTFDPQNDFVEDYDAISALEFFTETENICSECGWKLIDALTEFAANFKTKKDKDV